MNKERCCINRELKFRIWDGKKFLYNDCSKYIGFDSGGHASLRFGLPFLITEYRGSLSNNIQQYIGLKDKNGKEIYEGDILKVTLSEAGGFIGEVKFDEGRYYLHGSRDIHINKDLVIVVGNIFETPNLLPVKK